MRGIVTLKGLDDNVAGEKLESCWLQIFKQIGSNWLKLARQETRKLAHNLVYFGAFSDWMWLERLSIGRRKSSGIIINRRGR